MVKLIVVSGASGAGKTRLVQAVAETLAPTEVHYLRSVTTRNTRPDDGSMYLSITPNFFELLERGGGFLWTKTVHGNRYGTVKSDLERALKGPGVLVSVITPDCLVKIRDAARSFGCSEDEMLFIHVLSPGDDVLRARLISRGESPESAETRIADSRTWDTDVRTFGLPIVYVENKGTADELAEKVRKVFEGQ